MQTDDILLLTDESFANIEKESIKLTKIMFKTRERFISDNSFKFNEIRIERLDSNIYFRQEIHIQDIQLIQSIESFITSAREKVRVNLISRK